MRFLTVMRHLRKEHTLTEDRMALLDWLRTGAEPAADAAGEDDFLRRALRWLVQQLAHSYPGSWPTLWLSRRLRDRSRCQALGGGPIPAGQRRA